MAATASNLILGQRDFNMSLRRVSSKLSATSSAIDLSRGRIFAFGSGLKGCSENYGNVFQNSNDFKSNSMGVNELQKVRAYGPSVPQRASEEIVGAEDKRQTRAANGGNSSGAMHQHSREKIMIAVDVDEVLGDFLSAINQFISDRYSINHSFSEYHVYEFFKIWNCSHDEANHRVYEFFKTPYFKEGIVPIPGAREALEKLSRIYNLSIVTSRQNVIKEPTIQWIHKHYPGLFREIQFGNHFALDGESRPKSEICKSLGAKVLIDDNPKYAIDCAAAGIKVLLFDYKNSYPWCKGEYAPPHPLVTKVHSWQEVEQKLATLAVS